MLEKYGSKELELASDPKNWEIWEAPKLQEIIYQVFPEWTCLCPRSGYPDFGIVYIISIPDKKLLELKHLKLWLNSFRNIGISHENATAKIANTLFDILELKYIFVLIQYSPRGNLTTFPMTEIIKDKDLSPSNDLQEIKKHLIKKII